MRTLLCLTLLLAACRGDSGPTEPEIPSPNPVPIALSLSRDTAMQGGSIVYFTVTGSQLLSSTKVTWDGDTLPVLSNVGGVISTYVSGTGLATPGPRSIRLVNPPPGGGTSEPLTFTVLPAPPVPVYDSVTPRNPEVYLLPETLTVHGSHFAPGAALQYNDVGTWKDVPSTWVDSTHLTVTWSATIGGASSIAYKTRVRNVSATPTPTLSGEQWLTVVAYDLRLFRISPDTVPLSVDTASLTLYGRRFTRPGSLGLWVHGQSYPATVLTDTSATVDLPTAGLEDGRTYYGYVGGIVSVDSLPIFALPTVPHPVAVGPVIGVGTVAPDDRRIVVNGTHFAQTSLIQIDGSDRATEFLNAFNLVTTLTVTDVATAGVHAIKVRTPAPGGGLSDTTLTLVVDDQRPVPVLDSIASDTIDLSGGPVLVHLYGSGFDSTSVIAFTRTPFGLGIGEFATTYVSPTELTALVVADDLVPPELIYLFVATPLPGGGESQRKEMIVE